MKTERLVQFAIQQTAIILAVLISIPVIGIMATLLLMIVADLFCEQLHGLMILSVVATAVTLAVRHIRRDTKKS